jgi:hypothetical protein
MDESESFVLFGSIFFLSHLEKLSTKLFHITEG